MDNHETFYLLVVGTRSFDDYKLLEEKLSQEIALKKARKVEIVSGGATGANALAKRFAFEKGYEYREFKADWDSYGNKAGYMRNREMHKYISGFPHRKCIAFWDGKSKGTSHSFKLAKDFENELLVIMY